MDSERKEEKTTDIQRQTKSYKKRLNLMEADGKQKRKTQRDR